MIHRDKLSAAIKRNLDEATISIWERKALIGLERVKSYHGCDFFRITYTALFNDMIAHIIKVLDKDRRSTTFWYVYDCYRKEIDSYFQKIGEDIQRIDKLASRLKIIRDKTHFHIDEKGVINPKTIWKQAAIKGTELAGFVDNIWEVLNYIHKLHFGDEFSAPDYTGEDATEILKLATEAGIGRLANPA